MELFRKKLKQNADHQLNQIETALYYAKDNGFKINWVAEDGSRCDFVHLKNVFESLGLSEVMHRYLSCSLYL